MKHYLLEAKISESEFKKDWSMVEYEGVCAIVQRWYEENLPMQERKQRNIFLVYPTLQLVVLQ